MPPGNILKNKVLELYHKHAQQENPLEPSTPRNVFDSNDNTPNKKAGGIFAPPNQRNPDHHGLLRQPSAPVMIRQDNKRYIEEQYSKYVKDIGQLLEGEEMKAEGGDGLRQDKDKNEFASAESNQNNNLANEDEGSNSSSNSSFPDQADREDDDEEEAETKENRLLKLLEQEEERKGTYEYDVRQSLNEPINLNDLRISMPLRTDELQDSINFFEQILKENYGESRFRRAMQIIEDFPGDIYHEQNERKILQKLSVKDIFGANEPAQTFLHECSSYLLMRQGASGFTGKSIGILSV